MSGKPIQRRDIAVIDLIEYLQELEEPDALIILSCDEEGNCFAPFSGASRDMYKDGEIALRALTPEDEQKGILTQEDVGQPEDGWKRCITLWP